MQQRPGRTAVPTALVLIAGLVLAIANVAVWLATLGRPSTDASSLVALYHLCAPCLVYFIAAPLVIVGLLAILFTRTAAFRIGAAVKEGTAPVAAAPPPAPAAAALRLLSLLQQEGRFLDFVAEDIDEYSDAQVGAAVRSIHAGCRKTLRERIALERVLSDEDGSQVVIKEDFDPAAVRLTGNVTGAPPFHGTLQHGGWRAASISLPESPAGVDTSIITPAEVEIP